MLKKDAVSKTRVSEIYTLSRDSEGECCFLGFTICFSDGTIENVTMEYHRDEFEQARL